MKKAMAKGRFLFLTVFLLALGACGMAGPGSQDSSDRSKSAGNVGPLSPGQEHAGEIMAYLLRVVLAQLGPTGSREKWSQVGLDGPLDLDRVYKAMTDSEQNIWDVMAMDTNLLPLSMVLFHYDDALSFSKGKTGWMSLYPMPEFIAIRMLLIRKIHRGEKIRLEALLAREPLLFNRELATTSEDLKAMNLHPDEWHLVRQIVAREPVLYRYLLSPFLVRSLHQAGAVERDEFVGRMLKRSNYKKYRCIWKSRSAKEAIRVAILPSLTKGFSRTEGVISADPYGFRPTEDLMAALRKLQTGIKTCLQGYFEARWSALRPESGDQTRAEVREDSVRERVSICVQDQRPLAIYPGCTEEVIGDVCPEADFAVILLGKDVYLALSYEDEKRPSGKVGWAYVDMDDVERGRMDSLCERLTTGIFEKPTR